MQLFVYFFPIAAAFLIPCHRVIQSTGSFGNGMWGEF